ncbi:MAG: PilZ domain-containing protein [Roseburia sp.]|nr:PilZ domain-containing protein [Roseburia sp.]
MLIEELSSGQVITLIAIIGNEQLTFDTTILETYPKKRLILAAPIYRNEKIVAFRAKDIQINLQVSQNESAPVLFKDVTISLMKKPDESLCYAITTQAEGKASNRRDSFRCFLGIESVMQYGPSHAKYRAVLRDVSMGGFSVTCDAATNFHENQILHVLLRDYIEELAEQYTFHLYGIIVRTQELDNNRILYGCRLNTKVPGLETYISKKERMRLRKTNGRT